MFEKILVSKFIGVFSRVLTIIPADVDVSPLMALMYAIIPIVFLVAIVKMIPKMLDKFGR